MAAAWEMDNYRKEVDLYKRSLALWGADTQILKLAEEAAELAVACLHLNKFRDPQKMWAEFVEEIADVEFMLSEMKYCFPGLQTEVNQIRAVKRDRLAVILEKKLEKRAHE